MRQTKGLDLLRHYCEEVVLKVYATCVQTMEHFSKVIILALFDTSLFVVLTLRYV